MTERGMASREGLARRAGRERAQGSAVGGGRARVPRETCAHIAVMTVGIWGARVSKDGPREPPRVASARSLRERKGAAERAASGQERSD